MMPVRLWLLLALNCNLTLQINENNRGCLFGDSLFYVSNKFSLCHSESRVITPIVTSWMNIGKNYSCKMQHNSL